MFTPKKICFTLHLMVLIGNERKENGSHQNCSSIRFYGPQYYQGFNWASNEKGRWPISRRSLMITPFHHFQTQAIRAIPAKSGRRKLCQMRQNAEVNSKKKRRCNVRKKVKSRKLAKPHGLSSHALGNSRKLRNRKKIKVKKKKKKPYKSKTLTSTQPSASDNPLITHALENIPSTTTTERGFYTHSFTPPSTTPRYLGMFIFQRLKDISRNNIFV